MITYLSRNGITNINLGYKIAKIIDKYDGDFLFEV